MSTPPSLARDISPPPIRKPRRSNSKRCKLDSVDEPRLDLVPDSRPSLAAIEAGEARIRDHLAYFTAHFEQVARPVTEHKPRLSIADFQQLYKRNQHAHGRHFVVHQHDHPVSGVHYDLRLQFSASSAISFAVPYGLPGSPNSSRPNRMAIETRVHNVWNNLIESASHSTGSLMIWDTGQYEVLPRRTSKQAPQTDSESASSDGDSTISINDTQSDSSKLFHAFQSRHIRLRLHGTLLPPGYTIALRLPSAMNSNSQPRKPKRKRRRKPDHVIKVAGPILSDSDSDTTASSPRPAQPVGLNTDVDADAGIASDNDEDEAIRQSNAYPGAQNTINSIHQRHWFLTLDRPGSGFVKPRTGADVGRWVRGRDNDGAAKGFEPFFVRGRDVESSVVTGRLAGEIMADEGVRMYAGRKMWRPIIE